MNGNGISLLCKVIIHLLMDMRNLDTGCFAIYLSLLELDFGSLI